jgi:hypothetical protein
MWDSSLKQNRLYLNGALEAIGSTGFARTNASSSILQIPLRDSKVCFSGKLFALAIWNRALSAAEVKALQTNPDWNLKSVAQTTFLADESRLPRLDRSAGRPCR